MRTLRSRVDLVIETYKIWRDDRTIRLGAGLAYYGLFAFVPLLALAVAMATLLFARQDAQEYLADRLEDLFGPEGRQLATLVNEQLVSAATQTGLGVLGAVSLLLATSLFVLALQDAFNTIWNVPVVPGFAMTLRRRLRALLVTITTVALLSATLLVHTAANVLNLILPDGVRSVDYLVGVINALGSWGLLALAMVLLYRFFTPARVSLRPLVLVGLLTAALATLGSWAFGVYLREFGGASLTGVAGSLLLALLWIYYEVQIVLAGAQLVKVMHRHDLEHESPPRG